jgi:CBS domain-containing protein
MKCAEIMTINPKMCVPDDDIAVAAGLMWDYDCGVIPVVKNLESKELVGIITDRDIAMHVVKHAYTHPCEVKVNDCMSTKVISCQSEDPIESVISDMGTYQVHRIPIVDQNGSCVGIISVTDLLAHAEGMEEQIFSTMKQISSSPAKASEEVAVEEEKAEKESTGE